VTPRADLWLAGACSARALELTLDSLLGQTETRFCVRVPAAAGEGSSAALLARYADPRLLPGECADERAPFAAEIEAGAVLAPTWLARLADALDGDPAAGAAQCRVSLFDGARLRAAPANETCPAVLRRRGADFSSRPLGSDASLRQLGGEASLRQLGGEASLRQLGGDAAGRVLTLADKLAIRRVPGAAMPPQAQRRLETSLYGLAYAPSAIEAERPPTLHVVVDTEAEFDWDKPFAETLTGVSAMTQVGSAQAIFDRYGLRPTYVVDYPVAAQDAGADAIGAIAARGGCAVGAHLHPWTNPPFGAAIDQAMSFPGNLPEAVEREKLDALLALMTRRFGEPPAFYKAGRYGLGPHTARLIASRGIGVDFSLMPETDMRDVHGPDFRMVAAIPYDVGDLGLLAVPMTRADLGPLSRWWRLRGWLDTQTAALLHVRGMLVRAGLLERLTLTPEGVSAKLQIVLLRTLLRRGHRLFVLHFHSPSLAAGHTPYVRNEAERAAFLARIDTVCRWFFEELGGVPGRPWDLLPVERRSRYKG
jgi:hypothetical protein